MLPQTQQLQRPGALLERFSYLNSSSSSDWERCRSILQQLQRLGVLLERSVASEAALAANGSVTGVF